MKNTMQKGGVLWWIVIIIVLVIAGYFLFRGSGASVPATQTQAAPAAIGDVATTTTAVPAPVAPVVTYRADGFSPRVITIKKGEIVSWQNTSGKPMWVGSDVHPTHTAYDGTTLREHCKTLPSTSFDQCGRGDTYSFTFTKTGSFKYHNHADAEYGGTVVVTE